MKQEQEDSPQRRNAGGKNLSRSAASTRRRGASTTRRRSWRRGRRGCVAHHPAGLGKQTQPRNQKEEDAACALCALAPRRALALAGPCSCAPADDYDCWLGAAAPKARPHDDGWRRRRPRTSRRRCLGVFARGARFKVIRISCEARIKVRVDWSTALLAWSSFVCKSGQRGHQYCTRARPRLVVHIQRHSRPRVTPE
jgi:hypothetical protein